MASDEKAGTRLMRREELRDAIAEEETRLARLHDERADAESRLARLRAEFAFLNPDLPITASPRATVAAAERPFVHALIVRDTGFKATNDGSRAIQELYAALAADEKRNRLILDDVVQALEEGRSPILLTERRDHLEYFAARLQNFARHLVVLQGGMSIKQRRDVKEKLAGIPRLHPMKKEVRIFDYVDRDVPIFLRMFEKRRRGYRAMGYTTGEAPLGYGEPGDEVVLEYDEDVLRELEERDEFV